MIIFPNCKENKPIFLLSQNLQESRKEALNRTEDFEQIRVFQIKWWMSQQSL
jgi:hypothetical protein